MQGQIKGAEDGPFPNRTTFCTLIILPSFSLYLTDQITYLLIFYY